MAGKTYRVPPGTMQVATLLRTDAQMAGSGKLTHRGGMCPRLKSAAWPTIDDTRLEICKRSPGPHVMQSRAITAEGAQDARLWDEKALAREQAKRF